MEENVILQAINALREDFNKRFDVMQIAQDELKLEVRALRKGYEKLEIELHETREELCGRMDKLEDRMSSIEDRMDKLEGRMDRQEQRMEGIENFTGRFVDIVSDTINKEQKDNARDHEEFREALKLSS